VLTVNGVVDSFINTVGSMTYSGHKLFVTDTGQSSNIYTKVTAAQPWVQFSAVGGVPLNAPVFTPPGVLTVSMLNPSDINGSLVFSNGNKTVKTTAAGLNMVRAAGYIPYNMRVYFEVTIDAPAEHFAVGISDDQFIASLSHGLGFTPIDEASISYRPESDYEAGRTYMQDVVYSAGQTNNVAGNTVGVCISFGNVFFTSEGMQADGNDWNNVAGTNIGGNSGALGPAVPSVYYATFTCSEAGAQATFNFDGPFKFTAPASNGYIPYSAGAQLNTLAIPSASIAAPTGLRAGTSTSTSVVLQWNAVSGATSYNIRWIDPANTVNWSPTVNSTTNSYTATFPSTDAGLFTIFEVQTVTSAGVSAWSNPQTISIPPINTSTTIQSSTPGVISSTSTSITFGLQPYDQTNPTAAAFQVQIYLWPISAAWKFNAHAQFTSPTLAWIKSARLPSSTSVLTVSGLTANTAYYALVFTYAKSTDTTPQIGGGTIPCVTTFPATGDAIIQKNVFVDAPTYVPAGAIPITWGGLIDLTLMPVAASANFAAYYDTTAFTATAGASMTNSVLSIAESVYGQCCIWFNTDSALNAASRETTINPDGSKVSIMLTAAQGFAGAHQYCINADIALSAANITDVANVDFYRMVLVAELTEVFMPQLSALPDCDQHTVGEGLSIAMAFSLYPNGMLTASSANNAAAYYLNITVDPVTGAPSPTGTRRGDWVNTNPAGEGGNQVPAIGCATLFFGYLTSQLGYSFTEICTAMGTLPAYATLRQIHNKLTGTTTDPYPAFIGLINGAYPPATFVDNAHFTQNPFPIGQTSFVPTFITPGSGSFTDTHGNVYTITAAGVATEAKGGTNPQPMPGGSGTSQMAYWNTVVYAQDHTSLNWFIWQDPTFIAAPSPPAGAPVVVATGLTVPWQIAFLPDGSFLVTQRDTFNVRHCAANGTTLGTFSIPNTVTTSGEGGLMGIAVDPNFATNNYIYVCHTRTYNGGYTTNGNEVIRYTLNASANTISAGKILITYGSGQYHNGGGLGIGPDGCLYITTGNGTNPNNTSQVLTGSAVNDGKILRINLDGSIPLDNPFNTDGTKATFTKDTGYIEALKWLNNTANPITSFSVTYTVPPAPATTEGQILYLWGGLQSSDAQFLLQPVLQWGDAASGGGGPFWSLSTYWLSSDPVTGKPLPFVATAPVKVAPGTSIQCLVTCTAGTRGQKNFAYTAQFVGYPGTVYSVSGQEELNFPIIALEAYPNNNTSNPTLRACSAYPNTDFTTMGSIAINTGTPGTTGSPVAPTWTVDVAFTDCGEGITGSGTSYNFYYRNAPGVVARSAVWTWGHRNPQGICWDPSGNCWSSENGPTGESFGSFSGIQGNDKINFIAKGLNYGFPLTYGAGTATDSFGVTTQPPALTSGSSEVWAPEGIVARYDAILFCALGGVGNITGTKTLNQFTRVGNTQTQITKRLNDGHRKRAAVIGPDGWLYYSTSDGDGRGSQAAGTDVIYKINLSGWV
jgi:glucose/arabinose dehydrogenase